MIYLRDDDVLVPSSGWRSPFERFKQVHEWALLAWPNLMHVPTVIVEEVQDFPACIEYMRKETLEGRMLPELHGMFHVDYAKLSDDHVRDHLAEGIEWMETHIGRRPKTWYTPWGADNELLRDAAHRAGLALVGVNKKLGLAHVTGQLRTGETDVDSIQWREIMMHWWEGGCRAARLALTIKHGTWEAAALAQPELF